MAEIECTYESYNIAEIKKAIMRCSMNEPIAAQLRKITQTDTLLYLEIGTKQMLWPKIFSNYNEINAVLEMELMPFNKLITINS